MRGDAAVTLDEVATVKDTYEKITRVIRVNHARGIRVAIRKQGDANTVEVTKRVLAEIESANQEFPQINIVPVINQGNFIERSIANVARSVIYGGGLAVLVLLFFLRNIRSTIVISLSIPISIVATFMLIYFGGFTLNLMTLGGLALGVGMMVDSSIVVLENIFRRLSENDETAEIAAVNGAGEVAPAIIASTITTLVIFLPLVFVRGVSGILFTELAYVIIFSLSCSLLVSLSLVPMMTARLFGLSHANYLKRFNRLRKISDRFATVSASFFNWLNDNYRFALDRVLDNPLITIAIAVLLVVSSLLLLPMIGSEFLPPSDEGEVRITGEMEIGTRLGLIDRQTRRIEEIVFSAVPEVVSSVVSVRGGRSSSGEIRLSLTPSSERERSNVEIADDLRHRLNGKVAGMKIRVRAPQGQFLLDRLIGSDQGLTIEIRGNDLDTLKSLSNRVANAIVDVPGITDVEVSRDSGMPQQSFHVNREKIADLGLSIRDVTGILETAVAGSKIGEFRSEGTAYRIFIQLKEVEKISLDEILNLTLTSPDGHQVALRNFVTTEKSLGPVVINRKDQQRMITVSANVSGRDLGSVAADVEFILGTLARPVGYDLRVAGDFEEQKKSSRELMISLILALMLVYMVLACQYESFINPLVVMFSVPVAAVGVLLTLFLTGTTLNVQSYIGCIMLGGIVVNNAILLVDQADRLKRRGAVTRDAIMEAGRRRLRPILMTTLTTILGLLPLAIGIGEGAEAQAPLARAVVGGLGASTLITLLLIPVIYSMFHQNRRSIEK